MISLSDRNAALLRKETGPIRTSEGRDLLTVAVPEFIR